MFGNNGSRLASWVIGFLPATRCQGLKRFLLRKIGGIQIGDRTTIVSGARFNGQYIKIGSDCHIGRGCVIYGLSPKAWITIGDWVSMGPEVFMTTGGHELAGGGTHRSNGVQLPITIGNNVGLAVRCIIMCGVTIGDDCHISPGVVISRNLKPKTTVAQAINRSYRVE